jgi:F420-0:gamma-glutamyl ligase-like protein
VKETLPPVIPKAEKTIEGLVRRYVEKNYQYEDGYFIVLSEQRLSVYEGNSKEGQQLHAFSFPNGADYSFLYE